MSDRIRTVLPFIALALLVFGAKLCLIATAGNATPYWDQWDAEADSLYRPFLEGTLRWSDLVSAHNEHRILTTRLLALLLLEINNGVWNPVLQMVVNAALHVLALLALLCFLKKCCPPSFHRWLMLFAGVLFSLPCGWGNTLAGFQAPFYFLLLFSFIFLWTTARCEAFTGPWLLGFACGVLGFFSMASGALVFAAGCMLLAVRWVMGIQRSTRALGGGLLLGLMFIAAVALTPAIPGHAQLKAVSAIKYFLAVWSIISWPAMIALLLVLWLLFILYHWWRRQSCSPAAPAIALGVYLPMVFFGMSHMRNRPKLTDASWFLFALCLWMCGQVAAIGYSRAAEPLSSRYLDVFAIGLIVNFVCLAFYHEQKCASPATMQRLWTVWVAIVVIGFMCLAPMLLQQIRTRHADSLEQERYTRAYLMTGNAAYLKNKPPGHIPYPDAARLKSLLDRESIRAILPKNIYAAQHKQEPELLRSAVQWLLQFSPFIMALGALLLLPCVFVRPGRADSRTADLPPPSRKL